MRNNNREKKAKRESVGLSRFLEGMDPTVVKAMQITGIGIIVASISAGLYLILVYEGTPWKAFIVLFVFAFIGFLMLAPDIAIKGGSKALDKSGDFIAKIKPSGLFKSRAHEDKQDKDIKEALETARKIKAAWDGTDRRGAVDRDSGHRRRDDDSTR